MSILKDLRKISRREATIDDMQEFDRQLKLESNDRGAALLAATNADLALTRTIYRVLRVKDEVKDDLDKPGGPLENFSQRITIGRALGLYGVDTEYNLTLLRLIRNTFAHAHVPITFDTEEIVAAVDLFRSIPLRPPFQLGADKRSAPTGSRAKFHHFCEIVTHNLIVWGTFEMAAARDVQLSAGSVVLCQPKPMP
jgi:hypothetical protein